MHCGPVGAGHFVKMVHNGIEYGLMAAYAEGFNVLRNAPGYGIDVASVAEVWRRGSVVASWLLDLAAAALTTIRSSRGPTSTSPTPARDDGPPSRRSAGASRPT